MPFAETWVDLEIIILSEASQREKDKYVFIFMWTLKKWHKLTYLQNRNRLTQKTNLVKQERRDKLGIWGE